MKKFLILDCTIRDGGYYNSWDFNDDLIKSYIESVNELPIDYFEIGYRSPKKTEYVGKFFYTPIPILKHIKSKTTKKIALMLNQKDINDKNLYDLLNECQDLVDMVRIAVSPNNFSESLKLATEIKKMKFKVAFNLMYMGKWINDELLYPKLTGLEKYVDYLYMVDSYGSVYPSQVKEAIHQIKKHTNVKLGFHGHNNIELAFANTLSAIESDIDIIDSTFTGMGRGAGNLKTELILSHLNSIKLFDIDFNILSHIVDKFDELKKKYKWGTNLPYMISGFYSITQKFIMDLFNVNFLDTKSIINILNKDINSSNIKLNKIDLQLKYDKIIVFGGGKYFLNIIDDIKMLINKNNNIALVFASSRYIHLFNELDIDKYVCVIGSDFNRISRNEVNYDKTSFIAFSSEFEMPALVPVYIESKSFIVDELFQKDLPVNTTNLALYISSKLSKGNVYIVGYDGYLEKKIGRKERKLISDNNKIFKFISEEYTNKYVFLYQTKYDYLKVESLYSLL